MPWSSLYSTDSTSPHPSSPTANMVGLFSRSAAVKVTLYVKTRCDQIRRVSNFERFKHDRTRKSIVVRARTRLQSRESRSRQPKNSAFIFPLVITKSLQRRHSCDDSLGCCASLSALCRSANTVYDPTSRQRNAPVVVGTNRPTSRRYRANRRCIWRRYRADRNTKLDVYFHVSGAARQGRFCRELDLVEDSWGKEGRRGDILGKARRLYT